jgi:hypothetical protein
MKSRIVAVIDTAQTTNAERSVREIGGSRDSWSGSFPGGLDVVDRRGHRRPDGRFRSLARP